MRFFGGSNELDRADGKAGAVLKARMGRAWILKQFGPHDYVASSLQQKMDGSRDKVLG